MTHETHVREVDPILPFAFAKTHAGGCAALLPRPFPKHFEVSQDQAAAREIEPGIIP